MRTETVHDYQQAIARAAGFSPFHFSRMFTGMVGESPGEFLRRLRLERAAWLLHHGRASVTDTALQTGYERPEAFRRAFRAAFGCAPSAFSATGLSYTLPTPSALHFVPGGVVPVFVPRNTGGKEVDVTVRDNVPTMRVVALRHTGAYHRIGPVFGRLNAWLQAHGVAQVGPAIAIFHDDPETTDEDVLRSDACAQVAADFATDDNEVQVLDVPGGRYAVALHVGPYSGLGAAWGQFMGQWLPTSGLQIEEARPCFESYVDDCSQVDPEKVRTELYQAVR